MGSTWRASDLDSHFARNIVDRSRRVAQQVKAHDLEHALLVPPGAHVNVLDVSKLGDRFRSNSRLLAYFA